MFKRKFLLYFISLICFYSLAQSNDYEYDCDGDYCELIESAPKVKKASKAQSTPTKETSNWISTNLSPDFGEKVAEDLTLYLQKMTIEDHKKNFKRCYDTTQTFLLCYDTLDDAQRLETYKAMGFEEASRLYGMSLYLFDRLYTHCGSITMRLAIYQKAPHAFMGYIEFGSASQSGESDIQIYLLPDFRNKGYGLKAMNLALGYMRQYFNISSTDLTDGDTIKLLVNKIIQDTPGSHEFFSKKGSNAFEPEAVKAIVKTCKMLQGHNIFTEAIFKKFSARIRKTNTHSAELFKSLGFCLSSSNTFDEYYESPCSAMQK